MMSEVMKQTPLYDWHVAAGARMVPFAGWEMPVQYAGIMQEHRDVRKRAGLFDLGHMGQVAVSGPDALEYLQRVTTNDVSVLQAGQAQYSMLPNPDGGVIDDIIVYRNPNRDGYMVVVNASNHAKDVSWLMGQCQAESSLDVQVLDISSETGMIAIQGPKAEAIAQQLTATKLSQVGGFEWIQAEFNGVPTMTARTGYTGEDGFEFYQPIASISQLWNDLFNAGAGVGLVPVGLGARDTLRLEARMPLYGNELADDINPLEAGLGWAVSLDKGTFVGRDSIAAMKETGPPRKTVGFRLTERSGSARSHYPVQLDGREVGFVTSGAMSPTLGENIGLALIESSAAGVGKSLQVIVRDRPVQAVQVKLPFYRRDKA